MPIQLRKEKMKPWNIRFRKFAIVMLVFSVIFAISFGFLVEKIVAGYKQPVIIGAVTFFLYFISCIITAVIGIITYVREDNVSVLVQGIATCAPVIFNILNTKMVIIMLCSVFNKDNIVKKLLGEQNYYQFISTQYPYWVCILIGIVISMIIGVLAIVTFMKNGVNNSTKKKKAK